MEECTDAFENVSSFQSCVLFLSKRVYSSYIVFFCLRINEAGNKLFLEFLLLWNFSSILFFFSRILKIENLLIFRGIIEPITTRI